MPTKASWVVLDGQLIVEGIGTRGNLSDLTRGTVARPPASKTKQWRAVAPNLCVHPLWGDCVAVATDGIHSVVDVGDGNTLEVSNGQLLGPIGPQRVHPNDWDWSRNRRRVRVFKRKAPKPPVVIPVDTEMEAYWGRRSKLTEDEHLAYAAICPLKEPLASATPPELFESILEDLQIARSRAVPSQKPTGMAPKVKAALLED